MLCGIPSIIEQINKFRKISRLVGFLLFQMLDVSIVVLGDQEVAFRIPAVLDLGERQKDDDDQSNTDISEIAHRDCEERPYGIPVEHSEISTVIGEADPAGEESGSEYLDEAGAEGDDEAGFETALFIGHEADGGVVKEDGDESADDDRGGSEEDQGHDGNDLSGETCEESEGHGVGIAEAVADCAVDTGYGSGQELVSDSLEGSCELGDEGAYAELQDREINGELQAGVEHIERERFGLFCGAACHEEVFSDDAHDDAEEYGHQDGGADHVLIEDGEEAGHLKIADLLDLPLAALVSEELVSEPVTEADTEHLLVGDGESGTFREFLHGLDCQVGSDCPVGSEDDGHDDQKGYVVLCDLPFVHRFGVAQRGGVWYLIACTLKSAHAFRDDWTCLGRIWVPNFRRISGNTAKTTSSSCSRW